jgi:glycerate 2-kinase
MYIKNIHELARDELHIFALKLAEYALSVADPYNAITKKLQFMGDTLVIDDLKIVIEGCIHVVGFGKASKRMAEAVYDVLGDRVHGGVVITPNEEGFIGNIRLVRGDHPIPRENTLKSSQILLDYLVEKVDARDVVIVLISGGGSALFEVPEEGISLDEIAWVTKELMKRGADILELNAVRKRFSKVKGGKLLKFIKAKTAVSLIVSDVIGDRLDAIASGPTSPDETTFRDAYNILLKYKLWSDLSEKMRIVVEKGLRGEIEDTLKQGDPAFNIVRNIIVASNNIVLESIASKAREAGFNTLILTTMLEGEAKEVGRVLGSIIRSIYAHSFPVSKPAVLLAGGETIVTVRGKGIGGRNQELCLSLALSIKGLRNTVALCMGTDGVDGVSPAAGAVIDGSTIEEALSKGMNPIEYIDNNDSYTFFSQLKRAIITGYTGTNVNDIFISIIK